MTQHAAHPAPSEVGQLIDRLTQQRELYRQLKALSDEQATLIADGQTEQLLAVLSRRQGLVDQLGQLQQEVGPMRQRWPTLAESITPDQRQQVNRLLEDVESLLAAIIEQDDHDRQQLQQARKKVAGEMGQVNRRSQALGAYRNAPGRPAARFTDRQG